MQEIVRLEIDAHNVVVNQLLDPKEKNVMQVLESRVQMQKKYLDQVEELYPANAFHVVKMPLLENEVRGVDKLRQYAELAMDRAPVNANAPSGANGANGTTT